MEILLYPLKPGKLCLIRVTEKEALQLIQSLVSQVLVKDFNHECRLDFHCTGAATEMSITVHMEGGV